MLTKTGELLMRKKNEGQPKPPQFNPPPRHNEAPLRHTRPVTHISHVNEYNFMSISNKTAAEVQVSKEALQSLQVQNFRLIEENMRLVEWCRAFFSSTRQAIMRVIQGIEEFRYLDSVNRLYEVVGELAEYEQTGLQLPRSNAKEHYLNLKRLGSPQAKSYASANLELRRMQPFTFAPEPQPPKKSEEKVEEKDKEGGLLSLKMKADFSQLQPTLQEGAMLRMLLMQSCVIQSLVQSKMK